MQGKTSGILLALLAVTVTATAGGSATVERFYSEALGGYRSMVVYLPESYQTSGLDYPVIYLLPGGDGGVGSWYLTDFAPVLDDMIAAGLIDPMIVVEPDSNRTSPPQEWIQQGFNDQIFHYHANSELLGNHEDYLVDDLVDWVDWNYRTLADREHRLLIGRSIGGHGAIRLALRHPEVFGGASIDAGFMAVLEGYLPSQIIYVLALTPGPPYIYHPSNDVLSARFFAFCAAFAANMSNPPWYVDFLLDEYGEIDESVRRQMLAQSPPALVEGYAGSEYPLDLFLRVGDRDNMSNTFWPVIDALEAQEVPHLVRVFEGTHDTPSRLDKLVVHLTYFMPIKASAEISPRVADPRIHPQRLRVAVELPSDLEVEDIDCSTLALIDIDGNRLACPIGCAAVCEISDINGNGRDDLSMWLPCNTTVRAAMAGGAEPGDQIELTVRGELEDGRFFKATDTVTLASGGIAVAELD